MKGAEEIIEQAVATVHAALSMVGTDALKSLLHSLLTLAVHVAPTKSAEIPIIPFTVFTPGIGLELNIRDNIFALREWANNPPRSKADYMAMLRELSDEEIRMIVHLPNGVGKIPVQIVAIDREIEKLL